MKYSIKLFSLAFQNINAILSSMMVENASKLTDKTHSTYPVPTYFLIKKKTREKKSYCVLGEN